MTPENLDITEKTAKGNSYKVVVYVDPFPGRKGYERIYETCGKCSGTGAVGYGRFTLVKGGVEDRWCFQCNGTGKTSALVSSLRSTARRIAKADTLRNAEAADWAAEAPAREAAEKAAEEAKARAEAERRAALPKGFLGEEGERLRGLEAKVTKIRYYDSVGHYGQPEQKCIVAFEIAGKVAVWFTGWSQGMEEGQTVSLTGTVKGHDNYLGTDQTILTRCIIK